MPDDIGWEKILATALVTSFFTACLTEPVKAWIQRWIKRKELRECLYRQIVNNFGKLRGQIDMAKHDREMKSGIGQRFAMGYKRLAYDLALKDAALFYSLGYNELYWTELLYRDFEQVIHAEFDNDEIHLRNAEFVAHEVLSNLKNRHMSKHLMFKVSPVSLYATSGRTSTGAGASFDSASCGLKGTGLQGPPCILYFNENLKAKASEMKSLVSPAQVVPDERVKYVRPTYMAPAFQELLQKSGLDFVVVLGLS